MNFTQEKIFKTLKRGGYVIFRPHPINRFSEWGTVIDDEFTSIPTRAAPDLIEARYLISEPSRPHIDVLLALSLSVGQVSILRAMEQDAGLDRNTLPRGNASFGPFIYRLRGVVIPIEASVDRGQDVAVRADDVEGLNSLRMIQPAWIHSFPGDYTVYVLTDKGRDALRVLGPGAAGELQGWIETQGKVPEPVPSPSSRVIEALLA